MRAGKVLKKTILIFAAILAVTAALSFLQYYLQVHITSISWRSQAHLILDNGTECVQTVPVELEGVFYHYNVKRNGKIDSLELQATTRDHEIEIFRGVVVYDFADWYWQWCGHDRELTGYGHIDRQAMFTNYGKSKDEVAFLFCIDDVSKIIKDGEPGRKGILVVTKWETDNAAGILQELMEESDSGAKNFLQEYGILGNDVLSSGVKSGK